MSDYKDLAKNIISGYRDNIFSQDKLLNDPLRGEKKRIEIAANLLIAGIVFGELKNEEKEALKKIIISKQEEGIWIEYGYDINDDDVGYYGAVPTSFCIIALSLYYKETRDPDSLRAAIKAMDKLYYNENNGYVRKAGVNKSDVLNTNLLAGIAAFFVSEVLHKDSMRSKHYKEMAMRTVARSVSYQTWRGLFPYHHTTIRVPILYQAMTVALLHFFALKTNDEITIRTVNSGVKGLLSFWDRNSGTYNWKKADLKDKEGAVWAYTFGYVLFRYYGYLSEECISRLKSMQSDTGLLINGDFDDRVDPFYTSWSLFGLSLTHILQGKNYKSKLSKIGCLKFNVIKAICILKRFSVTYSYIINRIRNVFITVGTVENQKWYKF